MNNKTSSLFTVLGQFSHNSLRRDFANSLQIDIVFLHLMTCSHVSTLLHRGHLFLHLLLFIIIILTPYGFTPWAHLIIDVVT